MPPHSVLSAAVLSVKCRALSVKCRALSVKCRELSVKCRALSVKCRELSVKCRELSVKCRGLGVKCRELKLEFNALTLAIGHCQVLGQPAQDLDDLAFGGEPALFLLREELPVVHAHDEDAARAADELTLVSEGSFDLGRQTGGPGKVVSNAAVIDSNVHEEPFTTETQRSTE